MRAATRVQQAAAAQHAQREHATEEQLRLAARAAEERAAAAEAVALDLRWVLVIIRQQRVSYDDCLTWKSDGQLTPRVVCTGLGVGVADITCLSCVSTPCRVHGLQCPLPRHQCSHQGAGFLGWAGGWDLAVWEALHQ